MIVTLARKSLRARWGRNVFVALSIAFGVSFVAGSFVLADSMRAAFEDLFDELTEDVDLQVRSRLEGVEATDAALRDPVPAELLEQVAAVPGVSRAIGDYNRYAQLTKQDGEPVTTSGAPTLGLAWDEPISRDRGVQIREGAPPVGPDQVAIDLASADDHGYEVGDTIGVILDSGLREFTIAGLAARPDDESFGGATTAFFDRRYAGEILGAQGEYDSISITLADGADVVDAREAIAEFLPAGVEVVTGDEVADETKDQIGVFIDAFGTGLLVFALVTAFVSAFIINNIFGITITQRLREMALLRAVGANGRQIRRLIILEALAIALLGTLVGVFGGLLVAKGLITAFNAAGAGFPDIALKMLPRTVLVSLIVGIGTVLLAVLVPARRAARIPAVAAMRPDVGYTQLTATRRLVGGVVLTGVGLVMFLIGLFVRPGGAMGLAVLGGLGALVTFVGIASLSATVAYPVARAIGLPIQRLFPVAGKMARDNAARSPRRTARTASALMIGMALISAAAVFAASLRDSFAKVLESSIQADYIVTDASFMGLPPLVSETLYGVTELSAVSPLRAIRGTVTTPDGDDDGIAIAAVDPESFPELVNLDVTEGGFDALTGPGAVTDGVVVYREVAADLGLEVGDGFDVTYQNGSTSPLEVVGLFDDNSLDGAWYITLDHFEAVSDQPARDAMVLAQLGDGVTLDQADAAMDAALEQFPQVEVQDNAEFRDEISSQIDQLLYLITMLLGFAIALSFFGIAVTLAMSVFERTREIGLLRAVGMSRRKLRRAVRWEAVIVAVFGVVVGAVVGIGMGVALTAAAPDNVISLLTIPWSVLVFALVFAIVAAVVAATYPAYKASRMDVLEAITHE